MTGNDHSERLLSLDILRGADMMVLVLLQPIVWTAIAIGNPPEGTFLHGVLMQLEHGPWVGFCFWDIIMPLFMFMSGITIPFSMSKYRDGRAVAGAAFWRRLAKRFVVLWVLGMFCQGNLMDLDIHTLKLYSNTLQSIAVGYVAVAVLFVCCRPRTRYVVVALCLAAFIAVFAIWDDFSFTRYNNIAEEIDRAVLGPFSDGGSWVNGTWVWNQDYNYTWILSSLNFIVTVFLGCEAGRILHDKTTTAARKLRLLVVWGVALTVAGLALHPVVPIIKHIWSSSMTLFAGGICFLLMALTYWLVDMKHRTRGTAWLRYYGMNALAAYCLAHVSFNSLTDTFFHGLQQWMGDYYEVVQVTVSGIIIYIIIRAMYKHGIFLKA